MPTLSESRLAYTTGEVARLLGISTRTVCRMAENGSLPYKRVRGREKNGRGIILIPAKALEKFLSQPDMPRQDEMKNKAREIAKSAVTRLRKVK